MSEAKEYHLGSRGQHILAMLGKSLRSEHSKNVKSSEDPAINGGDVNDDENKSYSENYENESHSGNKENSPCVDESLGEISNFRLDCENVSTIGTTDTEVEIYMTNEIGIATASSEDYISLQDEVQQAINVLSSQSLSLERYIPDQSEGAIAAEISTPRNDQRVEILDDDPNDLDLRSDIEMEESDSEEETVAEEGRIDTVEKENDRSRDMSTHKEEDTKSGEKKRKRKADPNKWNYMQNKKKRERGDDYMGMRKDGDGHWKFDVTRGAKQLKPSCDCHQSSKDTKIKCRLFREEDRMQIFNKFWKKMSWPERKIYVNSLVDTIIPSDHKNQQNLVSRRSRTNFCFLKKNGVRIRVCKKMFLNTLGIGEWQLNNWISPKKTSPDDSRRIFQVENARKLRFTEKKTNLNTFFDALPKMESHYCRASSSKMYLEPVWQSKSSLFQEYTRYCNENNEGALSIKCFHEEFNNKNLALFRPKKDQCDLCVGYQVKNISEEKYLEHISRKNRARMEKDSDKQTASHIYTMDLQATLLAPMLKASRAYYKKKLVVHNFTVYDLKHHDGFCYVWHEGEAGVTSNEFATIIYNFIEDHSHVEAGEEVILWSDGCSYQNRNTNLSNALLHMAARRNINITQKFLVSGHTQMECDSMHSIIERTLKNREIYSPGGYVGSFKAARKKPKPYQVQYLIHTYFKDFSNLGYYRNIRPGFKIGDPTVNAMCAIQYRPNYEIYFKLNFDDEWTIMPKRNRSSTAGDIKSLYKSARAIHKSKYDHLQDLKEVIPRDYHIFYDNLKHDNSH